MTDFTVSFATATLAEGGIYSFSITPNAALASAIKVRWEIVADGKLPISADDFSSVTGVVDFAAQATSAQTVTITPTDDSAFEVTQNFQIRVYQVVGADDSGSAETNDILLGAQAVTLTDDDAGAGASVAVTPASNTEGNVNTAANTQDFALNAKGGNDTYIITRFQSGDVRIAESAGTDLIKFDFGVEIVKFEETSTSNFVRLKIESATLTLSTGAEIEIEFPDRTTSFQLGDDAIITSYAAFKTAIGASGTNATSTLTTPETIESFTSAPDVSTNTIAVAAEVLESTGLSDVIGLGGVADVRANGAGGDDIFVITRFQTGNVEIDDTVGTNIIKFDYGVQITAFTETSRISFGQHTVSSATLTLFTGAEIAIAFPAGAFNFQLGDAAVIETYAAFKTAIGASLSNADSTLPTPHTISHPSSVNTPLTGAVTADTPLAVNVHGLVFTAKAGISVNAQTRIGFQNTESNTLGVSFSSNVLLLDFDADATNQNTLGEILAILQADTDVTNNFVLTTAGVSYDANAATTLIDAADGDISTFFTLTSAPTYVIGTTLTANTSALVDANGIGALSYQWLRAGVAISDATASTYTLVAADVAQPVTVRVSFIDGGGAAESVTSVVVVLPANIPPVLMVNGVDAGATQAVNVAENTPITEAVIAFTATDGNPTDVLTYALGGADAALFDISAAGVLTFKTSPNFEAPTDAGVNNIYNVRVNVSDGTDTDSTAVAVTVTDVNDAPTGAVTVSSATTKSDSSLTIHGLVFTLKADAVNANAQTRIGFVSSTTSPEAAFSTNENLLEIIYEINTGHQETFAGFLAFFKQQAAFIDNFVLTINADYVATAATGVLDTLNNGGGLRSSYSFYNLVTTNAVTTYTADASAIIDADGLGAFSYQWLRDGAVISGATSTTYTQVAADIAKAITVRVSYLDSRGVAETVTSVVANAPTTGAVTIIYVDVSSPTGLPNIGEVLIAITTDLTDTDDDALAFTYQWQLDGADISGATAKTYTTTAAGSYTVTVTAEDSVTFVDTDITSAATIVATKTVSKTVNGVSYAEYKLGDGALADVLDASAETGKQLIQGGALGDTITASAHGDIVAGGAGDDEIALASGVNRVIHRFTKNGNDWTNSDGADTINNFQRGTDKIVFVDTSSSPITTLPAFLTALEASDAEGWVQSFAEPDTPTYGGKIHRVDIRFGDSGDYLRINFDGEANGANLQHASALGAAINAPFYIGFQPIHKIADFTMLESILGVGGLEITDSAGVGFDIL